jgi:hypothetical protein
MNKWFCFWLCALFAIALVLVTYSDHELLSAADLHLRDENIREETTQQVEARLSYEFEQREKCLRKEIGQQRQTERKESEFTLRKTRWGMTPKEVIATEGSDYIKRDKTTLIYKAHTAGLPSIVKYIFRGGRLIKSDLYFNNPRLSKVLPIQPHEKVEANFQRLVTLLTQKYGSPKTSTQVVSPSKKLSQKRDRLNDKLTATQQQCYTAVRERSHQRQKLEQKYKGWKHADGRIQDQLKEKDRQINRLEKSIKSIKKQHAALTSQLREEQQQRLNGELPMETVCQWCKSGDYDITLTRRRTSEGDSLWARYNGYITPKLSASPDDF